MARPAFGHDPPREARPAAETNREEPGDGGLFEVVLRETEAAFDGAGVADSSLLADLSAVARAHPGRPFDARPVGAELVRVLLDRQVSRAVAESGIWRRVCERVADALCADPVARPRLERLWGHLQGPAR